MSLSILLPACLHLVAHLVGYTFSCCFSFVSKIPDPLQFFTPTEKGKAKGVDSTSRHFQLSSSLVEVFVCIEVEFVCAARRASGIWASRSAK